MTTLTIGTPLEQTGLTRTDFMTIDDLRRALDEADIGVLHELRPWEVSPEYETFLRAKMQDSLAHPERHINF